MQESTTAAFDAFAVTQGPALLRLAVALCGDQHRAEDLVQEALARAYLAWAKVSAADRPDAYVRRTLVNAYRSSLRRRRVREIFPERMPDGVVADIADGLAGGAEIIAALASLPAGMRAVVVLRHLEDLPENEVAQLLRVTVGTVKSQNSKGITRLRTLLGASMEVSS